MSLRKKRDAMDANIKGLNAARSKVKAGGRRILDVAAILWWLPAASFALNPVIQTMYTADPAPMVHDGTLYLFSGHDEDVGEGVTLLQEQVAPLRAATSDDMLMYSDRLNNMMEWY
jgi:hypothetical protein